MRNRLDSIQSLLLICTKLRHLIAALCIGSDFGPPTIELAFCPIQYFGTNHAGDRKNKHADEHLIGLKGRPGNGNHKSKPGPPLVSSR